MITPAVVLSSDKSLDHNAGVLTQRAYKKHNSFVTIRVSATHLRGVLVRIGRFQKCLENFKLDEYVKRVVDRACKDILEQSEKKLNHPIFRLHSYVIDEIDRRLHSYAT